MKKLSNSELTTFCGQLALILRSGISSIEGLSIMIEDTPEGEGKKYWKICFMKQNRPEVSIWLLKHPGVFLPICAAWLKSANSPAVWMM